MRGQTPQSRFQAVFRWLPLPLWCYGVPMLLRTLGWLPGEHASYAWITASLFPVALALLLLGVDLPALSRIGLKALAAMGVGAAGIVLGGPIMGWALHAQLPREAWQGVGTLAATWTGGSLNMVALRSILNVPDQVFAPLVVVDALVAYSWMACLMACKGLEAPLDRWLRASAGGEQVPCSVTSHTERVRLSRRRMVWAGLLAIGVVAGCRLLAPTASGLGGLVASRTGWTVLLVTTVVLLLSFAPAVRGLGREGGAIGYPCLYLVLASLGAQASLAALAATPSWLLLGAGMVLLHALFLLIGGRCLRVPLAVLATASQANVGGVVSAPLVGAVYHQRLAPVGLILAIAGNAVGTYLGLAGATLARWLMK
ncbi:MAG: DUF819 family protein [Candidatus Omnitrophica bacterium]|nr:DUF819 family protein [Candidatus Omnitrophota bacterium]